MLRINLYGQFSTLKVQSYPPILIVHLSGVRLFPSLVAISVDGMVVLGIFPLNREVSLMIDDLGEHQSKGLLLSVGAIALHSSSNVSIRPVAARLPLSHSALLQAYLPHCSSRGGSVSVPGSLVAYMF